MRIYGIWWLPSTWQLSASGDGGLPEVVADPQGEVAVAFQTLGVCVVQQCAKIRQQGTSMYSDNTRVDIHAANGVNDCWSDVTYSCYTVSTAVTYDKTMKAIRVRVPEQDEEFYLHPATVRRNDRSAQSVVCEKSWLLRWWIK